MYNLFQLYFTKYPFKFLVIFFLNFIAIPLAALEVFVINGLINALINDGNLFNNFVIFLIYIIISILNIFCLQYLIPNLGIQITTDLRKQILSTALGADYSYINSFRTGDIINRHDNNTFLVGNFLVRYISRITDLLSFFVLLILLYTQINKIIIAPILLNICLFFIINDVSKRIPNIVDEIHKQIGNVNNYFECIIQNIITVKAYKLENHAANNFHKYQNQLMEKKTKMIKKEYVVESLDETSIVINACLIPTIAILLVYYGRAELGLIASSLVIFPKVSGFYKTFSSLVIDYKKVIPLLPIISSMTNFKRKTKMKVLYRDTLKSGVYADKITFYYNEERKILENFSFQAIKGEITIIKGKSGIGKSTFLNLLLGRNHPKSGEIYFNTQEKEAEHSGFLNIAFMSPEPYFFNLSILQNLKMVSSLSSEEIRNYIEEVDEQYKTNFNDMYYKKLGTGGNLISAGQKQILSYIQALLTNPHVLILDEPTSNLDKEVASIVIESFKKIKLNKTIIISTHDSQIFNIADKIYDFNDRKEVLGRKGVC